MEMLKMWLKDLRIYCCKGIFIKNNKLSNIICIQKLGDATLKIKGVNGRYYQL